MRLPSVLALSILLACSSSTSRSPDTADPSPAATNPDCDPIVPARCGLPMPSSRWLVDDPSTPTGKRVAFGATTLPAYADGRPIDPAGFADLDGFSPGMPIVTYIEGATAEGLPGYEAIEASLADSSPTVLLDAETGVRIPHWAELDVTAHDASETALVIHPAVRLGDGKRYIAAIRRVVDGMGVPVPPSPAFRALRDGEASPAYTDIFARLAKAGIDRADLQVAWDWTTASKLWTTRRLVAMRDDALAKVGAAGPTYRITDVKEDPNPYIARRIEGMMTVPLYLDRPDPGGRLVLDASGLPVANGTYETPFLVLVPKKLMNGNDGPGALVQNGHGLLGDMSEGDDGYLARIADAEGYVAFSTNLTGMSGRPDKDFIIDTIAHDLTRFRSSVDRQQQGILNELLLMRMMKGRFVDEPLVQRNGASVIDPTRAYYRGDSQGGIFGATYMAVTTDVTRGLLGEPGMPYSLLLDRSKDFAAFGFLLSVTFPNKLDGRIVLGLIQMLWDRSEPDGYAPYITKDLLPSTPAHEVLLHVAIGDYQVTPLGAHMIARAIGARNLAPVNREVFGLEDGAAPLVGSAMVEFDFGLPHEPTGNIPPAGDGDPHEKVRSLKKAYEMADVFFRTGTVTQTCGGPCKGNDGD